jgi:hypothetical protein
MDVRVELYRASSDGEGQQYLGQAYANAAGHWAINHTGAAGCYTAIQTWEYTGTGVKVSSRFATTYCAQPGQAGFQVYVPIVIRP